MNIVRLNEMEDRVESAVKVNIQEEIKIIKEQIKEILRIENKKNKETNLKEANIDDVTVV